MEDTQNSIFALKTSAGKERDVSRMLARKANEAKQSPDSSNTTVGGISSVLVPESLKGYIIVESSSDLDMRDEELRGIPNLRGILEGMLSYDEVEKFLNPEPIISSLEKGSVVELISGPFKGERAKVVRIDESRDEVVLELIEAAVPIPVTVRADQIRIIQKEAD